MNRISVARSTVKARQIMYLRRVRINNAAVEQQQMLSILSACGLRQPACKTHAPYYIVICGLSGSAIFFQHHLINGTIFRRKKLSCFLLSLQFCLINFSL